MGGFKEPNCIECQKSIKLGQRYLRVYTDEPHSDGEYIGTRSSFETVHLRH